MNNGWMITFVTGRTELTPLGVDQLKTSPDGQFLYAQVKRTYGPDETKATYVVANILKYEPAAGQV